MLLRIPEPFDFELSTRRFRDFGTDGATVLHEGGLHRVVAGEERVEAVESEGAVGEEEREESVQEAEKKGRRRAAGIWVKRGQ